MNEMKEDQMRERDILSAGMKILGLCLLILGVLTFSRETLSLIVPWLQSDTSELPKGFWKLLSLRAFTRAIVSIIQIALGIYLCKGGKWFVSILADRSGDS